jgi:hypothetical protein
VLSFALVLALAVAPLPFSQGRARAAVPYVPGAEHSPVTAFAARFIADCEGQQWLLDETERLLNMKQTSIDYLEPAVLEAITSIGLEGRGIEGRLPKAIGYFTELEELLLSGNRLSGALPGELYTLTELKDIDLSNNRYEGPVPGGFARLPSLEVLRLTGNAYTGGVPIALTSPSPPGNLSATLKTLDLSHNNLTGGFIPELGNLQSLEFLDLSRNPLGGAIPAAITKLDNLEIFLAWDCGLTGELPSAVGDMRALRYLDLSRNRLTGGIPPGISALTDMRDISLTDNLLTGTVPDVFVGMTLLEQVHIDRNYIRGHIPASLLSAFQRGAAVSFSGNYMTGPDALAIERGSAGGAAVSSGNFLDGSAGRQYRLTGPSYQRFTSTGQAVNVYPLLRNIPAGGGVSIPKPMRPVSEYTVSATPPALASLIKISTGAGMINISLLEEIPYASGAAVTVSILDNDGSVYSAWSVRVGTEAPPPVRGGMVGGGGGYDSSPTGPALRTEEHIPYIMGYGDGSVRVDRPITREEAAAMLYRVYGGAEPAEAVSYSSYTDVDIDRWSAPHIEAARREKLMEGYPDGSFRPAGGMSRGEFAALLCRLAGLETPAGRPEDFPLTDVALNWSAPYIYAAFEAGFIQGYEDSSFRGERAVTRAEAAAMLNAALSRRPARGYFDESGASPYTDVTAGHWAYYEIMEASVRHSHEYEEAAGLAGGEGI